MVRQGVRHRVKDRERLLHELDRWLRTPRHQLSQGQRKLRWWIDLAMHCARQLRRTRASQMAAALTYHTLFSLMPTLVLMLVVLHSFVGDAQRVELREEVIGWALRPLSTEQLGPALPAPDKTPGPTELGRRPEFDAMREQLSDRIRHAIDQLEAVDFRGIGIVGILVFIYGATGLLSTVERSFNTVYGAAQGRPPYLRLPLYYTVITLAPIAVLAGQVLQRRFLGVLASDSSTGWLVGTLGVVTPVLATWGAFWLVYVLLPNTRVSLRMAVVGSFVGSALWLIAVELFRLYVNRAAFTTLYGALAVVPLFLFWLWLTWLIVLFGLELTYSLHTMHQGRLAHGRQEDEEDMLVDRTLLLPVVTRIALAFRQARLCYVHELGRELLLPEAGVRLLVRQLEEAGFVHRVEDRREVGYTLAMPAESIDAADVMAKAGAIAAPAFVRHATPFAALAQRLDLGLQRELGTTTVADLCRQVEAAMPGPGA